MNCPDSSTSWKRSSSSGISGAYCALWSACGIVGTASQSMGPDAQDEQREGGDGERDDGVVDEAEVVMDPRVAPPEAPADPGEGEAPDRGAEQRQRRVGRERP